MLTVDPKVKWEEVADKVIQLTYLIPGIFFVVVVDNHIYPFMNATKKNSGWMLRLFSLTFLGVRRAIVGVVFLIFFSLTILKLCNDI